MVVDIDKLELVNYIKQTLVNDPYIIATWLSPSGNGLKAMLYLEYDKQFHRADTWIYHEHCAFPQIKEYLQESLGIKIDNTGSDITRLCFVSYDRDIHLKREFKPFKVKCDLSNNQINRIRVGYNSRKSVKRALAEQKRISKLLKKSAQKDFEDYNIT